MAQRDQRLKASDIFRNSMPVFGSKVPFAEAFPDITDIRIEVSESSLGGGRQHHAVCTRDHLPGEYVDCSNPLCYRGGVSIGSILREMVRTRHMTAEVTRLCQSNEGSPKGRRIYRKCLHSFKIKVTLTYTEAAAGGTTLASDLEPNT